MPTYYAWYEMYPNASFNVASITVKKGDTISASVTYASSNKFVLSLTDGAQSFSITQTLAGAQRSSAEWVAEAPSSGNGVLPLSDFTAVNFSRASATINGVTGPIDNWANASINMVAGRSNSVIASTGPLNDAAGASSFTVTYSAPPSSPPPPPQPSGHHRGWHAPHEAFAQGSTTGIPMAGSNAVMLDFAAVVPAGVSAVDFAAPQPAATFQQAASRLDAPALSPVLSVLTLSGPRAGVASDAADAIDDADLLSLWLPAGATTARDAVPGSFAQTVTTQRSRPLIGTDAAPMQVLLGAQAGDVFAEPLPAPTPTPTPEQRAESGGNFVARTVAKAIWLVGAVGFIAHGALVGKPRVKTIRATKGLKRGNKSRCAHCQSPSDKRGNDADPRLALGL